MAGKIILKHADGTLVTAQEAYDAFMTTRVLIDYDSAISSVATIKWFDTNSAQSDPTNVGCVFMYWQNNEGTLTNARVGDSSFVPSKETT